jgi:hypothetical protein
MEVNNAPSLEAIALGHAWAEERVAGMRARVPAEQRPDA